MKNFKVSLSSVLSYHIPAQEQRSTKTKRAQYGGKVFQIEMFIDDIVIVYRCYQHDVEAQNFISVDRALCRASNYLTVSVPISNYVCVASRKVKER
jgi:hypothetical protein